MSDPPLARLGLLGGTFDPPHFGHLVAAQEAGFRLGLDRVLMVPANLNPLKQGAEITAAEDRFAMVEAAIQGDPLLGISRIDLDRPAPSYTSELLRILREELPDTELFFIVGADVLAELHSWHEPEEVLRLARLVALSRPGWPAPDLTRLVEGLPRAAERVVPLTIPGVDVSSSMVRERVQASEPIRYLVPDAVESYIRDHRLYQG